MAYSDESFNKIVVNFVKIEVLYTKYRVIFFSRLKVHNYRKSSCLELTLSSLLTSATSSIPIIASKAVYQSFGSGLAFTGWT